MFGRCRDSCLKRHFVRFEKLPTFERTVSEMASMGQ
jgi:hypothetical protein